MLLGHYGIEVEEKDIVLFVGIIPIAIDVAFKYWIFKGGLGAAVLDLCAGSLCRRCWALCCLWAPSPSQPTSPSSTGSSRVGVLMSCACDVLAVGVLLVSGIVLFVGIIPIGNGAVSYRNTWIVKRHASQLHPPLTLSLPHPPPPRSQQDQPRRRGDNQGARPPLRRPVADSAWTVTPRALLAAGAMAGCRRVRRRQLQRVQPVDFVGGTRGASFCQSLIGSQ